MIEFPFPVLRQRDAEDAPQEDPPNAGRADSDAGFMARPMRIDPMSLWSEDDEIDPDVADIRQDDAHDAAPQDE